MKKACLLFFIASIGAAAFAQEPANAYFDADRLIAEGLFENRNEIEDSAVFLTPVQKNVLYRDHKKEAAIPFLANWFVGFGIGSMLQGDLTGVATIYITGLVGTGMIVYGMYPMIQMANYSPDFASDADYEAYYSELNRRMEQNMPIIIAGYGVFLAAGVYSLIRPWMYASSWNTALESALYPDKAGDISLIPFADTDSLGAGVRIQL